MNNVTKFILSICILILFLSIQVYEDNSNGIDLNDNCEFDSIYKIDTNKQAQIYYVDFWASWCAPCVRNLRFFNRLPTIIDTSKIGLIAISLDENKVNYANAAFKYLDSKYPEFRLINATENCFLKKKLMLQSLPRYIIVNNKGMVLNDNAPSPSNPELFDILNSLVH